MKFVTTSHIRVRPRVVGGAGTKAARDPRFLRSKRLMSEDTLRRGLASGVAATGFAAFEGAKPGRSTDLRGVVGDDGGGGAAARWGDASGVVAGARTVSGSGTAGNLLLEPTRLGGVAGEIGEGGGGGASTTSPGGAAAGGAFINAARRASSALAFTGTTPLNSAATVTTAAAGLSPGASASAALARTTLSESHARARHA